MKHPPQTPDGERGESESHTQNKAWKPTGFDTIYPRLKSVRKRALREMYQRGGEASTTVLKAADGGNIPEGSFEMHLAWLRGKRRNGDARQWWPDGANPLIEIDRKEDRKYGPTRIFALTEYGEQFVQYMFDEEDHTSDESVQELRMAIRGRGEQLSSLTARVESLEEDEDDGELKELRGRVSAVEEQLEEHERYIHTILDHLSE